METVRLAYGETGLDLRVDPAVTTVVTPRHHRATEAPREILRRALRAPVAGPPLRERVRPGRTVAISACDGTRPQPRELMIPAIPAIPAILEELDGLVDLADVVVLVATGTHRGNSQAELRRMFGDEVVDSVRIVNHDARDRSSLTWMGEFGAGVPVWLNSEWVDADVRITTGFVEPHFFAGFSGGPKLVAPGLAALETVLVLHDARRIGDPRAAWGIVEGNPVQDDVRAIAHASSPPPHAPSDPTGCSPSPPTPPAWPPRS
jgi:nickel-dependent lactate racemase